MKFRSEEQRLRSRIEELSGDRQSLLNSLVRMENEKANLIAAINKTDRELGILSHHLDLEMKASSL